MYEIQRDQWLSEVPVAIQADSWGNPRYLAQSLAHWWSLNTSMRALLACYDAKLAKTSTWAKQSPDPAQGLYHCLLVQAERERKPNPAWHVDWFFLAHKTFLCCSLSCPRVYSRGSSTRHLLLFIFMLGCRESIFATQHTLHFGNLPSPSPPPLASPFRCIFHFKLNMKCDGCPLRLPDLQPTLHLPPPCRGSRPPSV